MHIFHMTVLLSNQFLTKVDLLFISFPIDDMTSHFLCSSVYCEFEGVSFAK